MDIKQIMLRLAFIFQSAILSRRSWRGGLCCGWLSFSRVLYPGVQGTNPQAVAVGFHFPECYTRVPACNGRRLLRLAFIFQSAIL